MLQMHIDAINQRQNTLRQTISAIVEITERIFHNWEMKNIKPMILKDVADITGFDISTISRVVKSTMQTRKVNDFKNYSDSDSLTNDDGEEVFNQGN